MRHRLLIAFVLSVAAVPALAQQDVKGSADHPVFPKRMEGFHISLYRQAEFEAVTLRTDKGPVTVEGKVTRFNYRRERDAPNPGGLAIRRNYENAAIEAGGEVMGRPGNASVIRLTARDGAEIWAQVTSSGNAGSLIYQLLVVERAPMKQQITAAAIAAALEEDGFVTLYINFATGQSTILPDSLPVVDQLSEALASAPALRVSIEGHTDEVGTAEANQALSESRAKAVVAALQSRNIAADRLQARGLGEGKPLGPNTTEDGRAKNRRVEVVRLR